MKTLAIAIAAVLAASFSIAASAQTGRPSSVEVPAAIDTPTSVTDNDGKATGSYARYLMLNGATRENALVAARNIDNPVQRAPRLAAGRRADRATVRQ